MENCYTLQDECKRVLRVFDSKETAISSINESCKSVENISNPANESIMVFSVILKNKRTHETLILEKRKIFKTVCDLR